MHCNRRLTVQTLVFSHSYLHRQVSPPETPVVKGGTTWARNGRWILPENARLPRNNQGSFTCRKSTTWDKRLYFLSEGRRAENFFRPEKSDGFGPCLKPANLGTKGQHTTSRPPKPVKKCFYYRYSDVANLISYKSCISRDIPWQLRQSRCALFNCYSPTAHRYSCVIERILGVIRHLKIRGGEIKSFYEWPFKLLKTKRNLLYIMNRFAPRSKHFSPRL